MSNYDIGRRRMASFLDVADLLRQYALHFPELPAPYITISSVSFQLSVRMLVEVDEFDTWREALNIPTSSVKLMKVSSNSTHLSAIHVVEIGAGERVVSVEVNLYAAGLPALEERPATELEGSHHRAMEALAPRSAFQLANEHIRGGCDHCRPSMRLPEMCPEGQRLSLAACNTITAETSGSTL